VLGWPVVAAATVLAVGKSYGPGLADLIQIVGGGGGALGALVGIVIPTPLEDPNRMWRNAGIGVTVGGVIGTTVAFALWAAIRLNGGVG